MPTKKGAGGRLQNYSSTTGRYVKTNYELLDPPKPPSRKEKARRREAVRRETLYNRAKNSRDPLVFDVFCAIEAELPGSVQFVNEYKFDPFLGKEREFDIITKKCIIEIKSGKKIKKGLRQFEGQKRYAESRRKKHIVYAPIMPTMAKNTYSKSDIVIVSNHIDLINLIKGYEK